MADYRSGRASARRLYKARRIARNASAGSKANSLASVMLAPYSAHPRSVSR